MSKHEKITAAQLNKQATPHCDKCGSSDIQSEAMVQWDTEQQEWKLLTVSENYCVCCRCGRDVQIKWRLT